MYPLSSLAHPCPTEELHRLHAAEVIVLHSGIIFPPMQVAPSCVCSVVSMQRRDLRRVRISFLSSFALPGVDGPTQFHHAVEHDAAGRINTESCFVVHVVALRADTTTSFSRAPPRKKRRHKRVPSQTRTLLAHAPAHFCLESFGSRTFHHVVEPAQCWASASIAQW